MSDRTDILVNVVTGSTPTDKEGLIYTCNCGWIDLGHMSSPQEPRIEIGATNLWRQIKEEIGEKRDDGFIIKYAQDHGGGDGSAKKGMGKYFGSHQSYWIKSGLSLSEKKSVALTIFKEVSVEFESVQNNIMSSVTNSGFSQEDLVSDLIGLYIAIGEISREQVLSLCYTVNGKMALKLWDKHGAVGENKNKTFLPKFNKIEEIVEEDEKCDCLNQPNIFPKELQTIKSIEKGILFKDYDIEDVISDAYDDVEKKVSKTINEGKKAIKNVKEKVNDVMKDLDYLEEKANKAKSVIDDFFNFIPQVY